MRLLTRSLPVVVLTSLVTHLQGAPLPQVRPAVFAPGQRALINLINAEGLMKRGQKDGLVMFDLLVTRLGTPAVPYTYRGTAGTDKLADEVLGQMRRSAWLPAVKGGQPKATIVFGTVVFAIVDGKPRVRIYLNQEERELMKQSDFIAPQLVVEQGQPFRLEWPAAAESRSGTVVVAVNVDRGGVVGNARLTYEEPKGHGFGGELMRNIHKAEFIPAFRNGQPTATQFEMPYFFRAGIGWNWKT